MNIRSFSYLAVIALGVIPNLSAPASVEAGVIPWTYNAIFGYGPVFPQRYGYPPGYVAMSPASGGWAGYGPGYYGSSMAWRPAATPMTVSYGPSYYGGGVVYGGGCGCDPCAVSSCDPCGGGCATGNCSTSGVNYSPAPVSEEKEEAEVTPTFKPTNPEKSSSPETSDDFVPVERRENEFISPRTNTTIPESSTIPNAESTIPGGATGEGTSTIPSAGETNTGGSTTIPNVNSTIPDVNERSTIPGGGNSTIPSDNRSTIPSAREFPPPINRPAPTEPTAEEVIPSTSVEPLELELIPVSRVVVDRDRVSMKAGYRIPSVARIQVPATPVLEAGSSSVVIR